MVRLLFCKYELKPFDHGAQHQNDETGYDQPNSIGGQHGNHSQFCQKAKGGKKDSQPESELLRCGYFIFSSKNSWVVNLYNY